MTCEVLSIYNRNNTNVITLKMKDLNGLYNVKNWNRNRKPDPIRIEEIASKSTHSGIVDGILCGWARNGSRTLQLYDGIHRYMASKDFPEIVVILKIIVTDYEQVIIDDFKNINKSISVPSIYLEEYNVYKIYVCNNVMDLFCDKWFNNRSPAKRPYSCNYNRDTFIDNVLSKLKIDFELPNIEKRIFEAILYTNDLAKDHVAKHGIKIYQKSISTNFYIMYFNNATIKHNIEEFVN